MVLKNLIFPTFESYRDYLYIMLSRRERAVIPLYTLSEDARCQLQEVGNKFNNLYGLGKTSIATRKKYAEIREELLGLARDIDNAVRKCSSKENEDILFSRLDIVYENIKYLQKEIYDVIRGEGAGEYNPFEKTEAANIKLAKKWNK